MYHDLNLSPIFLVSFFDIYFDSGPTSESLLWIVDSIILALHGV